MWVDSRVKPTWARQGKHTFKPPHTNYYFYKADTTALKTKTKQCSVDFVGVITVKMPVIQSFRQFHEAKENFNNIARQVKGLEAFIRQLTEIMNTRHYVYTKLRM